MKFQTHYFITAVVVFRTSVDIKIGQHIFLVVSILFTDTEF